MGGFGSGRRGKKDKTRNYHQIDIRQWRREGLLAHDRPFLICNERNGDTVTRVWAYIEKNCFTVLTSFRRDDGAEWQGTDVSFYFDFTPCNYGYSRTWFVCPTCCHRVAILYFEQGRWWSCRKCLKLAYASQCEDKVGRMRRRIKKIDRRLDESRYELICGCKPKWMHQRTYDRLKARRAEAKRIVDTAFVTSASRWLRR